MADSGVALRKGFPFTCMDGDRRHTMLRSEALSGLECSWTGSHAEILTKILIRAGLVSSLGGQAGNIIDLLIAQKDFGNISGPVLS